MRGRLVAEKQSKYVEINERLSEFEKTFTFAHELSHLIVEESPLGRCADAPNGPRLDHSRIEALCDLCAREILLPADWIRERLGGTPSLESAKTVSVALRYDIAFVAARLVEIEQWRAKLIWWERRNNIITATKVYPEMDAAFVAFMELVDEERSLPARSLASRAVVKGILRIRTSDGEFAYNAEAMPIGGDATLTLLNYT
jgi:Zn-dependent peptidase ImmA (M78 family)